MLNINKMNRYFVNSRSIRRVGKLQRGYVTAKCWQLDTYSSHQNISLKEQQLPGKDLKMDEVLIKVKAASINPIDLMMCEGFGKTLLRPIRYFGNVSEFPFIPGRDCAGDVVSVGKAVRHFKEGDKIWLARWPYNRGTHSEYVVAKQSEIGNMPLNLDYIEAGSIPYAASTAWNSLILNCNLHKQGGGKRILILAGSGGVGTLATQLCKAFESNVTVTCSGSSFEMMKKLGADNCVDYKSYNVMPELSTYQPYNAILDCSSTTQKDNYADLLLSSPTSKFISLSPPFLTETDDRGLVCGLASSVQELACGNISQQYAGKGSYVWGRFNSNSGILNQLKNLVETNKLQPVIDKVFDFKDAINAFNYVASGRAKGKIVLKL